jgi:hypothetical protein
MGSTCTAHAALLSAEEQTKSDEAAARIKGKKKQNAPARKKSAKPQKSELALTQQLEGSILASPPLPVSQKKQKKKSAKWTPEEDNNLLELVKELGLGRWKEIAEKMHPGTRSNKQCRERWVHCLDPEISKEPWCDAEDYLLLKMQLQVSENPSYGPAWSYAASELPGYDYIAETESSPLPLPGTVPPDPNHDARSHRQLCEKSMAQDL